MTDLAVIITAISRTGLADARVPALGRGMCLRSSRTPFLDAARALVAAGFPGNSVLVMRRQGQDAVTLRGRIGPASRLTIKETPFGPKLAPYNAFPTRPEAPHSEFQEEAATEHRAEPGEPHG